MKSRRLQKHEKDAFVRAVLQDVPTVDYQEQADKIVQEWAERQMPSEVLVAFRKHPDWIRGRYLSMPGCLSSIYTRTATENSSVIQDDHPDVYARLRELAEAADEQADTIQELRNQLTAAIEPCTTIAQAVKKLPEFEKYLPKEAEVTPDLPVANLVAGLTKAGWPKGGAQ